MFAAETIKLRIGTNAISQRTWELVRHLGLEDSVFCRSDENIKKYPMMRRLFGLRHPAADARLSVVTPFVMWFDDDSYIKAEDPHDWLRLVEQTVENADMIGSVYTIRLQGRQETWIMDQPWYTGLPVRRSQRVAFCTGGWWAIRTEVLQKFQWPPPELVHRGGDVMLGELCRQQQLRISDFSEGVAINANAEGVAARAPRRGFDSHPIGFA